MEGIWAILVIFFLISSVNKSLKRRVSTQSQQSQPHPSGKRRHAAQPHTAPMQPTARTPVQASAYQPIQPRVHETQIGMQDYTGSLGVASIEGLQPAGSLGDSSTEGLDLCDPSLDHDRIVLTEPPQNAPAQAVQALPAQWNANALVQAVVMHEVLNRPRFMGGKR